jgi:anti-sigma regulatory factor (Ser/Thr protein kinase)
MKGPSQSHIDDSTAGETWELISSFEHPAAPGNERQAMEQVSIAVQDINLPEIKLERLKTSVAEATMNAMEHGNKFRPELQVLIQVLRSGKRLKIVITDHGGGQPIPEAGHPDLDAKLAGLQSPRGWGLFLIKNMVDDMKVSSDDTHHTVEMFFNLEGGLNGSQAV